MQKYSLQTNRTAHYYTLNEAENCDTILLAIHGYAELAEKFIDNFKSLEGSKIYVVCPEALSLFYGRERTPVASWMTSQHRLDEIEDYICYLDKLTNTLNLDQFKTVNLLGFSQGVSTLLRWFWRTKLMAEIHLCCGSIPPELEPSSLSASISNCYYYYGDQDRLMKEELKDKALDDLDRINVAYQYVPFVGRHEISPLCLDKIKT